MVKSHGAELTAKARGTSRLVRFKKMNASEPSMKCRKCIDDIKTEGWSYPREKSGRNLNRYPGGVRHRDGMSLNQAPIWNMGTCRSDDEAKQARKYVSSEPIREKLQMAKSMRARVPMRSTGAERPVVVMKPGNAGGAKGSYYPAL